MLFSCYLRGDLPNIVTTEELKLVLLITIILYASPSPSTLTANTVNRYTPGSTPSMVNAVLVV